MNQCVIQELNLRSGVPLFSRRKGTPTVAHICKHYKQFLKHNTIFLKHKSIFVKHKPKLSKHNTKLSKHNTKLSKHNTKLSKHNTKLSKQHKILTGRSGKPRYESMKTRQVSNMAISSEVETFASKGKSYFSISEASLTVRKPVELEKPALLLWQRF